jgi:hypothetical protein
VLNACEVEHRGSPGEKEAEEARANLPIEQIVLEFVLVTPEAAIAGTVAVIWAGFKYAQRVLEKTQSEAANPLREPGAARQRVVQIELRLPALPAGRRERRTVLCL